MQVGGSVAAAAARWLACRTHPVSKPYTLRVADVADPEKSGEELNCRHEPSTKLPEWAG